MIHISKKIIEDSVDSSGKWRKSESVRGKQYITRSYVRWQHMRTRCKPGGDYQRKRPTYVGCSMSENFSDFQFFVEWHRKQVGYSSLKYHLDKDILLQNNKMYSEDICVLIPDKLNSFLVDHGAARGDYPQGVHCDTKEGYFRAQISEGGKRRMLGSYTTVQSAVSAYKAAKEAEAYRWYERLKAGEFVADSRVIERMRTWKLQ